MGHLPGDLAPSWSIKVGTKLVSLPVYLDPQKANLTLKNGFFFQVDFQAVEDQSKSAQGDRCGRTLIYRDSNDSNIGPAMGTKSPFYRKCVSDCCFAILHFEKFFLKGKFKIL